jgi:hypothetical protein
MPDTHAEQQKKPTTQRQSTRPAPATSTATPEHGPVSMRQLIQRALDDPSSLTAVDGAHLQRSIGNRAVGQMLAASSAKRAANPDAPVIQTKLTLGPAGDKYEQEADRTAKQVMRSLDAPAEQADVAPNETLAAKPFDTSLEAVKANGMARVAREYSASLAQRRQSGKGTLQAKPLADGISRIQREELEEDELQMKPKGDGISRIQREDLEDEDELQMKPKADGISHIQREELDDEDELQAKPLHGLEGGEVDPGVAATIGNAKGGGQPLHDGVRASMERGFGADFSGVRVHTGGQTDALNRSLNARAFTTGSDIFFGKGQYNPGSRGGQELIAHELTHTVQQGASVSRPNKIQTKLSIGLASDQFTVQRGIFDKKVSNLKKKYQSLKERITGKTEDKKEEPKEGGKVLKASIALTTNAQVRSVGNMSENGHAWIELEPLKPWTDIEKTTLPDKMSEATSNALKVHQWHTIGFYPDKGGKKALFGVPGKIVEPEKAVMIQNTQASKSFEMDATQAGKLLDYVKDKRTAKYSFLSYNCTGFAVGALNTAGFAANEFLGRVTSKRVTSPNKVYKRLFERAALGDKSVKIAKGMDTVQTGSLKWKKNKQTKHVNEPEEQALKQVEAEKQDLLESTEDISVSEDVQALGQFIFEKHKFKNIDYTTRQLVDMDRGLFEKMTAHEKRVLEVSYPYAFDEKIDDVLREINTPNLLEKNVPIKMGMTEKEADKTLTTELIPVHYMSLMHGKATIERLKEWKWHKKKQLVLDCIEAAGETSKKVVKLKLGLEWAEFTKLVSEL